MVAVPLEAEKVDISLEDLLQREGRAEVYDGELVELSASGSLQQFIIGSIVDLLSPFVRLHDLGLILGDGFT